MSWEFIGRGKPATMSLNLVSVGGTVYAIKESKNKLSVSIFDAEMLVWNRLEATEEGRGQTKISWSGITAVSHESLIYVWGGYLSGEGVCSHELFVLDTISLRWSKPPVMGSPPEGRWGHCAAVLRNRMYVFGGHNNKKHLSDLHYLDLHTLTWSSVSAQENGPSKRREMAGFALEDRYFVIFGGQCGQFYNDLHCFDTETNRWSVLEKRGKFPQRRGVFCNYRAFSYGNEICIFEGENNICYDTLYSYNRVKETWRVTKLVGSITETLDSSCIQINKDVIVFGPYKNHKMYRLKLSDISTFTENQPIPVESPCEHDEVVKTITYIPVQGEYSAHIAENHTVLHDAMKPPNFASSDTFPNFSDSTVAEMATANRQPRSTDENNSADANRKYIGSRLDNTNAHLVMYQDLMREILASPEFVPPAKFSAHHESSLTILREIYPHTSADIYRRELESQYKKYSLINLAKINGEAPAIGMDLGTTYSCIAICNEDGVEVIHNDREEFTTPSCVSYDEDDLPIAGQTGKNRAEQHPESTIYDMKRLLGRTYDSLPKGLWPFKIEDDDGLVNIRTFTSKTSPENVLTVLIQELKKYAEDYANEHIVNIVFAVPIEFDAWQRYLIKEACYDAGLNVLRLVSEPRASAIGYSEKEILFPEEDATSPEKLVLIFDLGGGTLDVAVLQISWGRTKLLAVDGNQSLGGEDFDKALMEHCIQEFERTNQLEGVRNELFPRQIRKLKAECELKKCHLSMPGVKSVEVDCEAFYKGKDLDVRVTKKAFADIIGPFIKTCMRIVNRVVKRAGVAQLDEVMLVGGSSRIPAIKEQLLAQEALRNCTFSKMTNPEHAVAKGAAILAYYLQNGMALENALLADLSLDFKL